MARRESDSLRVDIFDGASRLAELSVKSNDHPDTLPRRMSRFGRCVCLVALPRLYVNMGGFRGSFVNIILIEGYACH